MKNNLSNAWLSVLSVLVLATPGQVMGGSLRPQQGGEPTIKVGDRVPDALLSTTDGRPMRLTDSVGRVKVISIVPQLNTPVCDEQTHHVSEQNGGLDRTVDLITLSTNTSDDQARFAKKAKMTNIRFLSDAPAHAFGKQSGLLLPTYGILHRAMIVADQANVIRYFQLVPMGELPNFDAAFEAARRLSQGQ